MHQRPCWLDSAVPFHPPELSLPPRTDVAIIGGGYTGVAAARTLARRRIDVTLLERETLGWGASTRNGGFVLPGFKLEAGALLKRYGPERARALYEASLASVRFLEALLPEEDLDCDYLRSGHVTLAYRPAHYTEFERAAELLERVFGCEMSLLPRERLGEEIGSGFYHGALIDPRAGRIQPARYFFGLAAAAARAGARLLERADVTAIDRTGPGFRLRTSRGDLVAGQVVVATNGYSGGVHSWTRRRVVPVGSYVIATRPLEESLIRELIPGGRVLSDSKNLLYYFRLSPDHRMVFGGRASFSPTTIEESTRILAQGMGEVFPRLSRVPIEYAWKGNVGMTVDQLPHAGVVDGIHYALGYCGHGVAMSSYLGHRLGEAIAGQGDLLPFSELGFPAVPLYRGDPWFLPVVGAYYRFKDWVS